MEKSRGRRDWTSVCQLWKSEEDPAVVTVKGWPLSHERSVNDDVLMANRGQCFKNKRGDQS